MTAGQSDSAQGRAGRVDKPSRSSGSGEHASSSQEEDSQRLRVSRFFLAAGFSVVYLVVLGLFYTQGKVDSATLAETAAIVAVLIVAFYCVFRLRLNLQFADPSLTLFQVLAAIFTMLFVVYRAPETRLVFATFFLVALMFGMLGSSARQLSILGVVSLAAFAVVTVGRYSAIRDVEVLRIDLLQLCVTALAFPWFIFIGNRIKKLRDADRRKDEFLATLAHELRNPLAPIRMGIHLLKTRHVDSAPQPVLPIMERQLHHLTRLLDDLLDVSRINRGKVSLHLERVDLRRIVQTAVETIQPMIEEMGHELTLSLPGEPLWADVDSVRLSQVVSNLLSNAAKYTPQNGRISLMAQRSGHEIHITVRDNGYGIPMERIESIFDMFTQLESPVAKPVHGLGIGLSLAKGLVTLHHGTIEARSEGRGLGSEFRVRLPAGPTRVEDVAPAEDRPRVRHKLRVLVVDDNPDVATSLAMFLEAGGHDVRVAHDGETAVQLADEFRPHAVLLDLGMPGVDGFAACRRIRGMPWGKEVRIIAITGRGREEDRRASATAGFDEHLVKPVSPETLDRLLAQSQPA
jgi:signal transduction histidine kinase/CheY-like chemotaxis protein